MRYLEALIAGDEHRADRIKEQMTGGTCDPRWATTLAEYAKYFGPSGTRAKIAYVPPSEIGARTIEIPAQARVAFFGDWGTGAATARRVISLIADEKPDVLVHLGDIYYSGTPKECRANFTEIIRSILPQTPAFTLAGNHDMYSGGLGYYDLISKYNAGRLAQRSSFFCLRTSDGGWQILGMDTGLHDYSPLSVTDSLTYVEEEEQRWLEDRVDEFKGRTILASHHQMFSSFSQIGKPRQDGSLTSYNTNLLSLFRKLREKGDIAAWLWGHEHNMCIYEPYLGLDRGRCIGHGAIPIFEEENPYLTLKGIVDPPRIISGTQLGIRDGAYEHGFAIASLGAPGAKTSIEYFGQDGRIYEETL
jgi:hypothetical protein